MWILLHDANETSYISDLQPEHVEVLAVTVTHHQASALRTALYDHIALKARMQVKIPVSTGYHSFQVS